MLSVFLCAVFFKYTFKVSQYILLSLYTARCLLILPEHLNLWICSCHISLLLLSRDILTLFLHHFSTIISPAPSLVYSIKVTTPAELHASKGETVELSCTFTSTSRVTSKMNVDWSYTPQGGGPSHNVSIHVHVITVRRNLCLNVDILLFAPLSLICQPRCSSCLIGNLSKPGIFQLSCLFETSLGDVPRRPWLFSCLSLSSSVVELRSVLKCAQMYPSQPIAALKPLSPHTPSPGFSFSDQSTQNPPHDLSGSIWTQWYPWSVVLCNRIRSIVIHSVVAATLYPIISYRSTQSKVGGNVLWPLYLLKCCCLVLKCVGGRGEEGLGVCCINLLFE